MHAVDGTYNYMHATFSLRILDKSDKSSNMIPWGLLYLLRLSSRILQLGGSKGLKVMLA